MTAVVLPLGASRQEREIVALYTMPFSSTRVAAIMRTRGHQVSVAEVLRVVRRFGVVRRPGPRRGAKQNFTNAYHGDIDGDGELA